MGQVELELAVATSPQVLVARAARVLVTEQATGAV
jgi:hypothetical protein